ncbi:solute carrier family 2, facilitated glucose transporter member 5-like isoform X2 [Hemicordylus capensis]|uniref:solute carrier family 2, facilitated glucose transporter member 5-like isoform X2 n=1 Tax=Hemicordylus capensis TaxID=884348 RepID=UPI002304ADDC|nr:solute carrier family 2, facilitated glucose transporter member 5-like isoform X2 [Hemicordylus capensis]
MEIDQTDSGSKKGFIQGFYNETYREWNRINTDRKLVLFVWGLTTSFFPTGGLIGALLSGPLVDKCGRKGTLLLNNILPIISGVLMGCSKALQVYEFITFARLVIGISAGISSSVVPMYLAELAPLHLRGAITMLSHLFFAIGVLLVQIFGLHKILGTHEGWPIMLSLTAIPAVFQLLLLPSFPESPRYLLIQRRDEEKARQALKKLRGQDDVHDEIEELHQEDVAEKAEKQMNVCKLLHSQELRWAVISVVVLILGQQFSGAYVVYFYMKNIYLTTGINEENVSYMTVAVTMVLVLVTSMLIYVVDFWGRKFLLLSGFAICSISCLFLTMSLELQRTISWMSYISTAFVIIFLLGYTIGPAPIPSLVIAEIFLQSSRSSAFVVGQSVHWFCSFLMEMGFLHIQIYLWTYTFLIFSPICLATLIYIFKVIPETKNNTFLVNRRLVAIHANSLNMDPGQANEQKLRGHFV